jgi:hypothetical protein
VNPAATSPSFHGILRSIRTTRNSSNPSHRKPSGRQIASKPAQANEATKFPDCRARIENASTAKKREVSMLDETMNTKGEKNAIGRSADHDTAGGSPARDSTVAIATIAERSRTRLSQNPNPMTVPAPKSHI